MKKYLSIASLVVGVVGLGLFSQPVAEICCGVGGLVLSHFAKDNEAGDIIKGIRSWGRNFAWVNIAWVCLEMILKIAGVDIFG